MTHTIQQVTRDLLTYIHTYTHTNFFKYHLFLDLCGKLNYKTFPCTHINPYMYVQINCALNVKHVRVCFHYHRIYINVSKSAAHKVPMYIDHGERLRVNPYSVVHCTRKIPKMAWHILHYYIFILFGFVKKLKR